MYQRISVLAMLGKAKWICLPIPFPFNFTLFFLMTFTLTQAFSEESASERTSESTQEKADEEEALANIPALKESVMLTTQTKNEASQEPPQIIGLPDVVSYTLFNQWDIKISIEEVRRQKGLLQTATGAFDYIFGGIERMTWKQNVQLIPFKTNRSGYLNANELSLDHMARIGTKYSFKAEVDRELNPADLFNTPPYYRINSYIISFSIDQPLWKNFIYNPQFTTERIKRLDVMSAKYAMVQTIASHIRDVVQAYWDLVTAKRFYQIESDKKDRLIDLAKKSLLLIKGGQLNATELDQQYAEIYRQNRILAFTKQGVFAALNQLLLLMGGVAGCPPIDVPNLLLDHYPDLYQGNLNTCCLVDYAIGHRPDLFALDFKTLGTEVQLKAAEHNLLPELNVKLEGNVHNFALDRRAKPFFAAVNSRWPERDLTVEVNFSVPLYNDEAIGDFRRSRAENQQSIYQQAELIQEIKYNIATAVRNHYSLLAQLQAAAQAVKWYKITLKDERRKLLEGFSTIFVVVDFENRLSIAQSEQAQAYDDYAKNLVNLLYLTGTLVDYNCPMNQVTLSNMTDISHLFSPTRGRYD